MGSIVAEFLDLLVFDTLKRQFIPFLQALMKMKRIILFFVRL
jgi:hypothetical protein